jgi:CubicO group peptidase (beta-lactamase class C family)
MWAGVSGSAVVGKTSVTTDTLFSAGSITKTFVAALTGRLAMAGTIGLDDPLAKYIPDFPNAANITLRQLLNHTSGVVRPCRVMRDNMIVAWLSASKSVQSMATSTHFRAPNM